MIEVLEKPKHILESDHMDKKRISVSSKRQVTIPQKFFEMLNIKNELECYVKDGGIILKPLNNEGTGEFATEILKDLVQQGYSGNELVLKFQEMNRMVRPAIVDILMEADNAAYSLKGTGNSEMDDIFGSEGKDV